MCRIMPDIDNIFVHVLLSVDCNFPISIQTSSVATCYKDPRLILLIVELIGVSGGFYFLFFPRYR